MESEWKLLPLPGLGRKLEEASLTTAVSGLPPVEQNPLRDL
jgi:hypothetical protein